MPPSPSRQLVDAVKHGALDDLHRLLASGVDPSSVKQVKCLLVTALKHPDAQKATAMANALLSAGLSWKGRTRTSPLDLILQRRLVGVLPSLARIPKLTQVPIEGMDGFFLAGLVAVNGWSEGLRALAALGVDIRQGVDDHTFSELSAKSNRHYGRLRWWMSPAKKTDMGGEVEKGVLSTLRVWLAKVPRDAQDRLADSDWVKTAVWLMDAPIPTDRRLREQVGFALELAYLSGSLEADGELSAFPPLANAWMESPHWWADEAGRRAVNTFLSLVSMRPDREVPQLRREGWKHAKRIVERKRLSLDGSADVYTCSSTLIFAMIQCQNLSNKPRLLKRAVEGVAWAVQHGAHHRETSMQYGVLKPLWLSGFQREGMPWAAMMPLRQAGWNPLDLIPVWALPAGKEVIKKNLPLVHALKDSNLVGLKQYLQEFPQEVHRRNANGQTLLQHATEGELSKDRIERHKLKPLMDLFLDFGGDVTATDNQGEHFLHAVLNQKHDPHLDLDATVERMWNEWPEMFDVPNAQGVTPWQRLEDEKFHDLKFAQSLLRQRALRAAWQTKAPDTRKTARL